MRTVTTHINHGIRLNFVAVLEFDWHAQRIADQRAPQAPKDPIAQSHGSIEQRIFIQGQGLEGPLAATWPRGEAGAKGLSASFYFSSGSNRGKEGLEFSGGQRILDGLQFSLLRHEADLNALMYGGGDSF